MLYFIRKVSLWLAAFAVLIPLLIPSPAAAQSTVMQWGRIVSKDGDSSTKTFADLLTPVPVTGLVGVKMLACGTHNLALKFDGTVWGWRANSNGQIGDGTKIYHANPTQVLNLSHVTTIGGGISHSLAVKSDGTVWAWGSNGYGQLGDGTTTDRLTPVQVQNLTGPVAVFGGNSASFALMADGTVYAWGRNVVGQLGDGTTTDRLTPVKVGGLTNVVALAPGDLYCLALKSDGTVWAWGLNGAGSLGDGTTTDRHTPVKITTLSQVVALSPGVNRIHSLALKSDGTVWAWGGNHSGGLGLGSADDNAHPTPTRIPSLSGVTRIGAGYQFSLAQKSDGTAWSWGDNSVGTLGDGTTTERDTPVKISGLTNTLIIRGNTNGSVALLSSAKISGTVALDGLVPAAPSTPLDFTFRPVAGGADFTVTAPVGPDGAFSLPGMPFGNYTLHIKGKKWLAKNVAVNASNGDVSNVSATLPGGDANNDNTVNFDDFQILADAYFTTTSDPLFDDRADFNGDGEVNFDDFLILADNYFLVGD